MDNDRDRNGIQRRMADLRGGLDDDVHRVVDDTRRLVDYRYYIRRHPWVCVGAAFVVGFLIVPQRPRILTPDPDQLAALARRSQLIVRERPKPSKPEGLAQTLAVTVGSMLLRATVNYVGHKVSAALEKNQLRSSERGEMVHD